MHRDKGIFHLDVIGLDVVQIDVLTQGKCENLLMFENCLFVVLNLNVLVRYYNPQG